MSSLPGLFEAPESRPSRRRHGRGALLRSLRTLIRRIDPFGVHRATTQEERRWSQALTDRLEAAPGVRASLAVADAQALTDRLEAAPGVRASLANGERPDGCPV